MVKIQLHTDCPSTETMVPNQFIDCFMPEANGEFVKVYLYLLRCIHSHAYICTISAIADKFNNTEMDIIRALRYWQKVGLLTMEEDASGHICGINLLPMPETETVSSQTPVAESAKVIPEAISPAAPVYQTPAKRRYTADEILNFRKNENISELFFIVETYMKHPLSENDMNTVLFWHEELHFSTELIVYLLEYCISKGHSSIRYLDKVALGWHEKNITTVEQAKEDAAIHSQAYYGVMKAFGITGRSLVETEKDFIRKWTKEYAFDLPLIQEACSRTMTAIHQPSFEYTDSILNSWYKNQVHTLEDVRNLDKAYSKTKKVTVKTTSTPRKNSFNNFSSRDYDYDNLEEMLLSSSIH
ncbi:MAG: DnaD domain protein [Agathobacter sp.]|nr:DnaD domain protein [Agathobacter sp.]